MKDVVGFGALNVDLIYEIGSFGRLKGERSLKPGQEIFGSLEEFESIVNILRKVGRLRSKSGGGGAANTVFALARMGFSTGYIGKAGCDAHGDFLIQSLEGVDVSRIRRDKESGIALCLLDKFKERSIFLLPNANNTLTFKKTDLNYVRNFCFLHLTSFAGKVPFEAQKRMVKEVFPQVRISFDPGEVYARYGLKKLLPLIKKCYLLFLSQEEVKLVTGKEYLFGCRKLLQDGASIVVCKRGQSGSHIFSKDSEFEVPAEKVEIVDKTGAGDVYAAAFLAGLILKRSLYECARFATKAAALSITGYGREKYPTQKFLQECLKEMG